MIRSFSPSELVRQHCGDRIPVRGDGSHAHPLSLPALP